MFDGWRRRLRAMRRDTYALYLASRDPRVPWIPKVLAICVLAYATSPIDLIPDFIPVLGLLDDLLIIPLGLLAVARLIPADLLAEHRTAAAEARAPESRAGLVLVITTWLVLAGLGALAVLRLSR